MESDPAAPAPGLVLVQPNVEGTTTTLRIMASGASVGKTLSEGATVDSFFSERSAIKLALALGLSEERRRLHHRGKGAKEQAQGQQGTSFKCCSRAKHSID